MSSLKIQKIEEQRTRLLTDLQQIEYMIRGTYVETHRKCGKPNCWCAKQDVGHPSYQISWTQDAKSRSKAIPKEDIAWIKEMTGNYRKWRTARANIRKLENELRVLIDKIENDILKKTEKLRGYF
jgi:hypothetical protein